MKLLACLLASLALLFQAGVAWPPPLPPAPEFRAPPAALRTLDERTERIILPPPLPGAEILIVTRDPFYPAP